MSGWSLCAHVRRKCGVLLRLDTVFIGVGVSYQFMMPAYEYFLFAIRSFHYCCVHNTAYPPAPPRLSTEAISFQREGVEAERLSHGGGKARPWKRKRKIEEKKKQLQDATNTVTRAPVILVGERAVIPSQTRCSRTSMIGTYPEISSGRECIFPLELSKGV